MFVPAEDEPSFVDRDDEERLKAFVSLAFDPITIHNPTAMVQTTITDPLMAPRAKVGWFELRAVMKKIVSGSVFKVEMTIPPMIEAS